MKKLILLLFVIGFALPIKAKDKKVIYRKTQKVSFGAQDIDGKVRTPDGAYLIPKKGMKFMPLYKVEKRFDKSIKESVEFVR